MLRRIIFSIAAPALVACAAEHQGYLLRADTGQRSPVVFHDRPNGKHGSVEATMSNGEQCRGEFNTVPDQVTKNWESNGDIETEESQIGVAVLKCADDHVVRCNFSRAHEGPGSGRCFDNQGQKYSLNF
jgi:hypothetical protein